MKRLPSLLDWIKNNAGKTLMSLIAFVTAIIGFIRLIKGDIYLSFTILGFVILASLLLGFLYIAFHKVDSSFLPGRKLYSYQKYRPFAFGGVIFIVALSIVLFAFRSSRAFVITAFVGTVTLTAPPSQTPTPVPASTSTPTPEPTEVLLPKADVLIAEFDSHLATRQIEVARRLEADLQKRLRQYGLEDVNVKVVSQPVANEDEAQSVANRTGSKVVIWGWYDDLGINVRIFLSGGDQPGTEIPGSGEVPLVGSPGGDPAFVVRDVLPENISFLSLFVIGHLNYLSNQTAAGRAAFDAAMDSLPETAAIENEALLHFFKARQLDFTGSDDIDTIVCEYAKAIELDPDFAEAYNNLGVIMVRNFPNLGFYLGDFEICLEQAGVADYTSLFDRALELQPDWSLPAYNKWVTYWTTEDWRPGGFDLQGIKQGLEEVVRREPSFNPARVALSQIALEEGNLEEAIKWMESATSQDLAQPQDHYNLGQLYLRKEDVPAAKVEFEEALKGDPGELETHLALASLALQSGDEQAARQHLQLIPTLQEVPYDIGFTTSGHYATTVEAMAEILRSQLSFQAGDLPGAIQPLEKSVAVNEAVYRSMPFEHYLLGLLYALQGNTEKAEENWALNQGDTFIAAGLGDPKIDPEISNAISALAWYDLVKDCGEGDVKGWGSTNNPCLPTKMVDRVAAVYDRFHQWLPHRMYYVRHWPHIPSCPFVYTYDAEQGAWDVDTTALYKLAGPQSQAAQWRVLDHFDGRLVVWELEPEISYFDQLSIRVLDLSGRMWTLETDVPALQKADGEYLTLHRGKKLPLNFPGFEGIEQPQQIWLVAVGYYIRLGR